MTDTTGLVAKFDALDTAMNMDLIERSKEIHTALLALVSRTHHFQIGSPGTAKSMLVRSLAKRLGELDYDVIEEVPYKEIVLEAGPNGTDVRVERELMRKETRTATGYFQWLLTRYTTPEEVFGPPSLSALEHDRFERKTHRKMPEARLVFLDEIFRANSSILNALLTIMNERLFFNNGSDEMTPVSSIFAAANTEPEGEELGALWDRLHFRHEIKTIQDPGNFVRMMQTLRDPNPQPILSWAEVEQAQHLADQVTLPSDIYETMKTLRDNLATKGIEPTERRFMESLRIVQAEAFLNGRQIAEIDDMRPLRHVMWSELKDQREVERQVLELANPIDKEAQDLLERIESLETELKKVIDQGDNPKQIAKQAVEVHAKLHKAKQRMEELKTRCAESGRKSEKLTEVNKKFIDVAKMLMTRGFGVSGDSPIGI